MRRTILAVLFVAFILNGTPPAEHQSNTFYIQLVRGNNEDAPPEPGSRPVGIKVARHLRSALNWNNYWEIKRCQVAVCSGKVARVCLSKGREVEIDLTKGKCRKVTAFENGRVVQRMSRPAGEGMTLIGGERDGASAWFIVVRRDPPVDQAGEFTGP
jgi:hypothetical protein